MSTRRKDGNISGERKAGIKFPQKTVLIVESTRDLNWSYLLEHSDEKEQYHKPVVDVDEVDNETGDGLQKHGGQEHRLTADEIRELSEDKRSRQDAEK